MRINRIILTLLIMLACSTSIVFGYVIGNSNLGGFGYPEFSAMRPYPPYSKDRYSVESYRDEVEYYVRKAKDYVEAANNDIERVNEAKSDAINKANSAIEEYNRFVRGY